MNETHNHIIVSRFDWDWIGGGRGRLIISTRQGLADLVGETSVSVPSRGLGEMRVSEAYDGNVESLCLFG